MAEHTMKVENLPVNAGMILICDPSYFAQCKGHIAMVQGWQLPNGTYRVRWEVLDYGSGALEGSTVIQITSGQIVVVDPGRYINDDAAWLQWLKKTKGGELPEGNTAIIRTGVDATFTVILTLTRLRKRRN